MNKKRMRIALVCSFLFGVYVRANVFDMPQVYPKHCQLQQQLILTVRAGKIEEMERICREGVALLPEDATWQYNLACALAYRADKREALEALGRAIELGFRDHKAISADRDLAQLSAMPEFKRLLQKAEVLADQPIAGKNMASPATVFTGLPAEINASNTVWNFDAGCFKALFMLRNADMKPISAYAERYHGPGAEKIRGWMKEKSAAGNFGDLYVNRDDGHSLLTVSNFPGLTPVTYGVEARGRNTHLSLPNTIFDYPVLGNSSMSIVGGPFWRSMPRAALTEPVHVLTLLRYYMDNQCWFFPEHKDYDINTGDLFPVNTPYYVISQGASFSDQPFIEAFAAGMAALQPITKQTLITNKMLTPTLQMIFRATQKRLKTPEDYLTGAAHPVVFDVANLDVAAMIKMAHALRPEDIPPLVALRVLKEPQVEPGKDYFDLRPEGLFDTPFCIARIIRGMARERRITLEAMVAGSQPKLRVHWVILQGNTNKITIASLNEHATQVELSVSYHGVYRPIGRDGLPSPMTSSRVDIGCFVQNGAYYSAPAFISFYYLPNEERVYRDDRQILSVNYANTAHRYADPLLTMQKEWKDLYAYDAQGKLTGWYRTRSMGAPERFTYNGHKVLETDKQNRPVKACAVQYLPRQTGVSDAPPALTWVETPQIFTYTYVNDADSVGKAHTSTIGL